MLIGADWATKSFESSSIELIFEARVFVNRPSGHQLVLSMSKRKTNAGLSALVEVTALRWGTTTGIPRCHPALSGG